MARAKANPTADGTTIQISPIDLRTIVIPIYGTSPYVQHRFSQKAKAKIAASQIAGSASRSKKTREPRDFESDFESATHRDNEGRFGIPAAAFRNAMIDVCRAAGFMMTRAKIALFVQHDSYDDEDESPLVFIEGERIRYDAAVRNETGVVDLRARPMWREGWKATVRICFDAGMLSATDVVNLLDRAGAQIGIGEGRPFSKNSNGTGFGLFRVQSNQQRMAAE